MTARRLHQRRHFTTLSFWPPGEFHRRAPIARNRQIKIRARAAAQVHEPAVSRKRVEVALGIGRADHVEMTSAPRPMVASFTTGTKSSSRSLKMKESMMAKSRTPHPRESFASRQEREPFDS
jgi:hypothetical protein